MLIYVGKIVIKGNVGRVFKNVDKSKQMLVVS
jgi:hypothetical protein